MWGFYANTDDHPRNTLVADSDRTYQSFPIPEDGDHVNAPPWMLDGGDSVGGLIGI